MTDRNKRTETGRDRRGRFAQGNAGGPGRTAGTVEHRRELLAACTPDDVREIVQALKEQAKSGDVQAARELLNRLFGKPREAAPDIAIEVGDLNSSEEISRMLRVVVREAMSGRVPLAEAREIVGLLTSCLEASELRELLDGHDEELRRWRA